MKKTETRTSLLDVPVLSTLEGWSIGGYTLRLNVETALYVALAVVALVACFYNLGARTQSHDESLHCLYSWKLYAGDGYEHNPMMHGPFRFHINALFFFLLGTSDFAARVPAALAGVVLVLLPIFLRKELGRVGALIVSALTLISPVTLYYARYIRDDVFMMVWAMLIAIALFRYLDSRKAKWIYLGAIAVTLAMCTMENAYITGFIGFTFLVLLYAQQMLSRRGVRTTYTVGIVLVVLLTLGLIALNSYMGTLPDVAEGSPAPQGTITKAQVRKVIEFVFLLIGLLVVMLLGSILIKRDERVKPGLSLIAAYVVAIGVLVVVCAGAGGLAWLAIIQLPAGVLAPALFTVAQVVGVAVAIAAGAYGWWRLLQHARSKGWLPQPTDQSAGFEFRALYITVALVVVLFTLFYTTFFTNPKGLGSGTFGGITYWLAQQEVKRAGQPWYYYLILTPLYEFLPIGVGLAAMAYYFITGNVDRAEEVASQAEGEYRPSAPVVPYLVYWALSAWLIYSWAGEKMPWLMVHMVQPMIVLSGRFLDDVLYGVDWRKAWRGGGALLIVLVPIILLALGMVVGLPFLGRAFQGMSLQDLGDTSKWLLALVVGGGLSIAAIQIGRRLGWATAWRVVGVSVLILAGMLTIRFAVMASFINYDTAKEFLVYAHSTPDAKQTVQEIKEISRRLYGDETSIRFAYSSDATWPFEWYFETEFPNRVFFGKEPSRETTDVPVLVVGSEEIAKVEPFLGKRYYRFDRKLIWWPHQDYYMGLSFAMPAEKDRKSGKNYFFLDMHDAEKRREFWDVVFYRKYRQSLADWQPSHSFAFFVRKDVAAQLWDYGVAPTTTDLGASEELYTKGRKAVTAVQVWGKQGDGEGLFNSPRNVAIGPDGSVYVADSGNHRIQKLSADGTFITAWGHPCRMYEGQAGCQSSDGAGGFFDLWGIAVDKEGFVYVADTWNHRIQKFTAEGQFVSMWGSYGVAEAATGGEGLFWGPRSIAISPEGQVYVGDTGNKRIQVFTADGQFVAQWGGKGILDGQFDEPVGIAIGADGTSYVADTWNQRVQAFDAGHFFRRKWEIDTWYGQSLQNKPFLALDARNRVYATDPEGHRILVFDERGQFLASLGQYGIDDQGFQLPTGIAIDPQGYIYVADTGNHRVMKFAPLQ